MSRDSQNRRCGVVPNATFTAISRDEKAWLATHKSTGTAIATRAFGCARLSPIVPSDGAISAGRKDATAASVASAPAEPGTNRPTRRPARSRNGGSESKEK